MTTFYDILKPYFSESSEEMIKETRKNLGFACIENSIDFPAINKNEDDFGFSCASALDAACFFITALGFVIFIYGVFLFMVDTIPGIVVLSMALILFLIASVLFLVCQRNTNAFYQKTFVFVTIVKGLYKEHIESSSIEAILESSKLRTTLQPDDPVAQKLYMLEQEVNAQRPDFDQYLSVKEWLKTEAKYLELKDLVTASVEA